MFKVSYRGFRLSQAFYKVLPHVAENAFLNGDELLHKLQLFGILLWGLSPSFSLSFLTDILLPERRGALRVTCRTAHARTATFSVILQIVAPSRNVTGCQA